MADSKFLTAEEVSSVTVARSQLAPSGTGEPCELVRPSLRSERPFFTRSKSLMHGIKRIW
jgi:hypothetical protein